jgi:hypothetical protein
VQTVNTRMAIFTKQGRQFDITGKVLYGPVNTNNAFKGFGGQCEYNGEPWCDTTSWPAGG